LCLLARHRRRIAVVEPNDRISRRIEDTKSFHEAPPFCQATCPAPRNASCCPEPAAMPVSSELTSADERSETAVRAATATHCVVRLAWASHTGMRAPHSSACHSTPGARCVRARQINKLRVWCRCTVNSPDNVAKCLAAPLPEPRCGSPAALAMRCYCFARCRSTPYASGSMRPNRRWPGTRRRGIARDSAAGAPEPGT
jgi:hypothetical protein